MAHHHRQRPRRRPRGHRRRHARGRRSSRTSRSPTERCGALVDSARRSPACGRSRVAHEDAPGGGQRRVLVAGLGKRDEFGAEQARVAAAAVAGRAKELGAVSLSWAAPEGDGVAGALVEGTLLGLYTFDRFKSRARRRRRRRHRVARDRRRRPWTSGEVERARVARGGGQRRPRPAEPARQRGHARRSWPSARAEIADEHEALEVELLDREAIVERGMGAFAAVAQGTHVEPRLIVLRYRPRGATGPHLGFVGKAVTFDTGGISIKPCGEDAGDEVRHVGRRRRASRRWRPSPSSALPVTITAVVPATENMPSGHAVKPGDIVTAHERQDDRGQQHRRRGPADPGRRALLRRRAGRGADRGPRHAHRRDPRGAGPHLRRPLLERRRLVRARCGPPATRPARSAGGCRSTPSTSS